MGKLFPGIDAHLREWIASQPMFFVATAPLAADGHVNVSPKAPGDTLRVLDDHTVAYLDLVGSGAETIAHLRENGRIVIMMCAFEGPPRVVRLHGTGHIHLAGEADFTRLRERCRFEIDAPEQAERAIVVVEVERVADSCGYGVPLMSFAGTRPHTRAWAEKRLRSGGPHALETYQREKNAVSIDGLEAVPPTASAET